MDLYLLGASRVTGRLAVNKRLRPPSSHDPAQVKRGRYCVVTSSSLSTHHSSSPSSKPAELHGWAERKKRPLCTRSRGYGSGAVAISAIMSIVGGSSPHLPVVYSLSLAPLVLVVLVCVVMEVRIAYRIMTFCAASPFLVGLRVSVVKATR